MIIKYLTELLYDNECVIVADFGAFITQRHSAVIDYTNNRFTPPYKEIVFNNKLVADDGLLVDFICKKEQLTKEEAREKIQKFVNQSMAILEVNSYVEFEGFGKINVDFKGDFVFTLDENLNLLSDSYGMNVFDCNAIYRTETYHDLKEKITVEQKQKNTEYSVSSESVVEKNVEQVKKPTLFKSIAFATLAFLLIFMINWTTDKTDSNLASWNPFLYSSPNEFFINLLNDKVIETPNVEAAVTETPTSTEEIITPETPAEEVITPETPAVEESIEQIVVPEVTVEETPAEEIESQEILSEEVSTVEVSVEEIQDFYFIVGGSFKTEESAEKCLNIIKKNGFENASTLAKNEKGYIRVYYESFADKHDALIRLDAIRRDYNESAWLLFQK